MLSDEATPHGPGHQRGFFGLVGGAYGESIDRWKHEGQVADLSEGGCGDVVGFPHHGLRVLPHERKGIPGIEDVMRHLVEFTTDQEIRHGGGKAEAACGEGALARSAEAHGSSGRAVSAAHSLLRSAALQVHNGPWKIPNHVVFAANVWIRVAG